MFDKQYTKYYELFHQDKPYKKEIEFVYKWAGEPPSILDIGCGTAHYWKYYPLGVELRGIEKSSPMIDASKYRSQIFIGCVEKNEIKHRIEYDCVTALFNVLNYMQNLNWWKSLPLKKGGYFIFDVWDAEKVKADGFSESVKEIDGIKRTITPIHQDEMMVELNIQIEDKGIKFSEKHKMYIYSDEEINKFCGKEFEIEKIKKTKKWQTWWKLIKK